MDEEFLYALLVFAVSGVAVLGAFILIIDFLLCGCLLWERPVLDVLQGLTPLVLTVKCERQPSTFESLAAIERPDEPRILGVSNRRNTTTGSTIP